MKLDEHIFAGFYTITALEWKWMLASEPSRNKFRQKFYEEERKEYSFLTHYMICFEY